MDKETIIQKCYGIASWAKVRGQATLDKNEKEFSRCDAALDGLIKKFVEYIKNES